MKIEIKKLRKSDHKKAIQSAITGMHFNWYMDSRLLLNLYGRYFWYLEITRATQAIAAYVGDTFAGVLLAEIKGEQKPYRSFWKTCYIKLFHCLQSLSHKGGASLYEKTNKDMLAEYLKDNSPDGEITFLAATPSLSTKGVGSALLSELEHREPGKKIYLYTDDACTYQFYEKRGFSRMCERSIVLDMGKKQVPLKCFIYSKTVPR